MNKVTPSAATFSKLLLICLLLTLAWNPASPGAAQAGAVTSGYKAYVMAPLTDITDWTAFRAQLTTLKNKGVTAITTDVWWGKFEAAADQSFNWTYYKTYADNVRTVGIKWVPILSFHQCGGNVGDNCNIPIPSWLSNLGTTDQLDFVNESGFHNREYLSFWSGIDINQYDQAMASFATNFSSYTDIIDSIHIGTGPAGELRYPSYNAAAGWTYPSRGKLQAYSNVAKASFQSAMQTKYGTIGALNSAWGTTLTAWTQISPPTDGDNFFIGGTTSNYGKDFLGWYQGVLKQHLADVMTKAHLRLDTAIPVRLGAKMAGIHWHYTDPSMPHSAEYGAGYYNYGTLVDQFAASNADLIFTCLEMDNSQTGAPNYSAPKTLVITVANLAKTKNVPIYGENALAISNDVSKYNNSAEMAFNYGFKGFTLLRIGNVVDGAGNAVINGTVNELNTFADLLVLKPLAVTFTVNNVPAVAGDTFYLVGDRREIGMWQTVAPYRIQMSTTATTGQRQVTVSLAASRTYQFKMFKVSSGGVVTWENGTNKTYTTPATGSGASTTNWQP